jgi:hypothetical protein
MSQRHIIAVAALIAGISFVGLRAEKTAIKGKA